MFRYVHTNIIAKDSEKLIDFYKKVFHCKSIGETRDLTSHAKKQTLKADFEAYLDGFSPNVQEILEKFKFRDQIDTMIEADPF